MRKYSFRNKPLDRLIETSEGNYHSRGRRKRIEITIADNSRPLG
jgi:hypothetical protein